MRLKYQLSIAFYGDSNKKQKYAFKGFNRCKKGFKNDPNLSIFKHKSAPKNIMCKFLQEMTTVDGGGHPRLYSSAKETLVIFGYE